MSKYGVFSGPYFPAFGLNTERYEVSLRIQSECGKIRTRKISVPGHFSRSDRLIADFHCASGDVVRVDAKDVPRKTQLIINYQNQRYQKYLAYEVEYP